MNSFWAKKSKFACFVGNFIAVAIYAFNMAFFHLYCGYGVYVISYLYWVRNMDYHMTLNYANLFTPVIRFGLALFGVLAAFTELKFGKRGGIALSTVLYFISALGLYLGTNYYVIILFIVLFTIGHGCASLILIKNLLFFYPKKKGTIGGIISLFIGVTIIIIATFIEFCFINPKKEQLEEHGHYSKKVSYKIKDFTLFGLILIPVIGVLVQLFFNPYKNENGEEPKEINSENEEILSPNNLIAYTQVDSNGKNVDIEKVANEVESGDLKEIFLNSDDETKKEKEEIGKNMNDKNIDEKEKKRLKKLRKKLRKKQKQKELNEQKQFMKDAICSSRLWIDFFLILTSSIIEDFVSLTTRYHITVLLQLKQGTIMIFVAFISVSVIITGSIWACISDKVSFRSLAIFNCLVSIFTGATLSVFSYDRQIPFLITLLIHGLFSGSLTRSTATHFMNVYGINNYPFISGFLGALKGFSGFGLGLLGTFTFSGSAAGGKERREKMELFRAIVFASTWITVIALVISFFESDEKFISKKKNLKSNEGDETKEKSESEETDEEKENECINELKERID